MGHGQLAKSLAIYVEMVSFVLKKRLWGAWRGRLRSLVAVLEQSLGCCVEVENGSWDIQCKGYAMVRVRNKDLLPGQQWWAGAIKERESIYDLVLGL